MPDKLPALPEPLLTRLHSALLRWYAACRRDLPWRRTTDPYRIWVAEVMLQQTQVATVIPYYRRFLERFPSLTALASAGEDEVLQVWQGLGYYSRARNLQAGARHILQAHGGKIPHDERALRGCPSIGEYTAGALRSTAFDIPAAAVDGNVERVLCRLLAMPGEPKRAPLRQILRRAAEQLASQGRPGEVAQALMELGATVCTPRLPLCTECPWGQQCEARRHGEQETLPSRAQRRATVDVHLACAFVVDDGSVLLERCSDAPFWKGLWTLPYVEVAADQTPQAVLTERLAPRVGLVLRVGVPAATVRGSVTHHRILMTAYHCTTAGSISGSDAVLRLPPSDADSLALPSPHRRMLRLLLATSHG